MKNPLPILLLPLLASCAGPSPEPAIDRGAAWSLKMADSHGLANFDCFNKHRDSLATTPWDYVSGLVACALQEAYALHPERGDLYQAVKAYADLALATDKWGCHITKFNGKEALQPSNIDDVAAARIFFGLYRHETERGDTAAANRYRRAATLARNKLANDHNRIEAPLEGVGGFWHKMRYPNQMWLDGLFMGPAVYARWQAMFGEEVEGHEANMRAWDDIALQFRILFAHTWDAQERLCYHGWAADLADPSAFWAMREGPNKGCNPEFWGRAMGWFMGALTDVLELMPQEATARTELLDMYHKSADGLAQRQDSVTGLWYQLLRYDDTFRADGVGDVVDGKTYNQGTRANYLETSASAMFAYVYMKGSRLGLLPEAYSARGQKAFEGLVRHKVVDEGNGHIGIKDICASAGLGPANDPSRTGTANYYLEGDDTGIVKANEGKGIGTFILAATEYERLQSQPGR